MRNAAPLHLSVRNAAPPAGYAAPSYGLHCAAAAGVPPSVLQRAAQLVQAAQQGTPIQPAPMQLQARAVVLRLAETRFLPYYRAVVLHVM